ncbi:hypothetical protein ACFO6R_01795 [Eubacterium multiforme]|uniref:Uncharacterized protein n=1 Tax=Eubacterium multiforme TaxID=83339 RepID=A0ABT9UQV0_9FIRM|nr:hypothetical protein [Eubacterium multiforme]MDQ0148516.1 hypothetical protein [Eubacterium multiforme]
MAKYKVGEELLIVNDPTEEKEKLKELTKLSIEDDFAQISWGIKVLNVEYDKPNVTLTYRNINGETNKVFAVCKNIANFDQQKVLEKALLKAFQNEIIDISVGKNTGCIR